jgi:hypothetical protein
VRGSFINFEAKKMTKLANSITQYRRPDGTFVSIKDMTDDDLRAAEKDIDVRCEKSGRERASMERKENLLGAVWDAIFEELRNRNIRIVEPDKIQKDDEKI